MKKITLLIMLLFITGASLEVSAQNKIMLSGQVTGEGQPLGGVRVLSKIGGHKIITDSNGNFTIKTQIGDVLTFSFIGYT
ncbi:MAG: carboxypeptidase-like regulatory domain-containing protein, partial [Leeuwenhoekiella sp.]|nr:carboxypeptidase-like regulatory domain-containing protein [Leeuwenhoekiella sp.]